MQNTGTLANRVTWGCFVLELLKVEIVVDIHQLVEKSVQGYQHGLVDFVLFTL